MADRSISHFEILEELGRGGMGVVYKARDTRLDRFVAVKILHPERVTDAGRKRRFVQEAKAASALNHPNIVTIHDIDQADGVYFMAMEYVAGKTLDQLIPHNGLRLNEALTYAIQISDALAVAHKAGIVHRDLKPSNIMVVERRLVKVLDFGLAKLMPAIELKESDSTQTLDPQAPRTIEGTIMGTAAYMSPEQAEGKPVDTRSDIFSFGSNLYEMLTGRRAFERDTDAGTIAAILRDHPEPIRAALPVELKSIIEQCLKKDRATHPTHG